MLINKLCTHKLRCISAKIFASLKFQLQKPETTARSDRCMQIVYYQELRLYVNSVWAVGLTAMPRKNPTKIKLTGLRTSNLNEKKLEEWGLIIPAISPLPFLSNSGGWCRKGTLAMPFQEHFKNAVFYTMRRQHTSNKYLLSCRWFSCLYFDLCYVLRAVAVRKQKYCRYC